MVRVEAPQLGVSVCCFSATELTGDVSGWWVQQQPLSSLCAAPPDSGTSRASSQSALFPQPAQLTLTVSCKLATV